ncbi:MAG: prepilin-type N-terminal cleavage/methylation domain-containing protein [Rhodomicrobium sp.]
MPRSEKNSGFSLIEVLAALVVATLVSIALTHTVGNTRTNANRIRELIDMMVLSDNLLENLQPEKMHPGRIDGRSKGFNWRLDIAPALYATTTLQSSASVQNEKANSGAAKGIEPASHAQSQQTLTNNEAVEKWTAYRIAVEIKTSSGRKYVVNTNRIGRRAADEKQE